MRGSALWSLCLCNPFIIQVPIDPASPQPVPAHAARRWQRRRAATRCRRLADRGTPQLDAVLAAAGVALKGADLLLGLGALCGGGQHVSGSLTDIVQNGGQPWVLFLYFQSSVIYTPLSFAILLCLGSARITALARMPTRLRGRGLQCDKLTAAV